MYSDVRGAGWKNRYGQNVVEAETEQDFWDCHGKP